MVFLYIVDTKRVSSVYYGNAIKCFFLSVVAVAVLCLGAHAQKNNDSAHTFKSWDTIALKDMLWKKRVRREINIFERTNAPLRNDPQMPKGNVFASVMMHGLKTGAIKAYRDGDTTFSTPLSLGEIDSAVQCHAAGLSKLARAYLHSISGPVSSTDTSAIASCTFPDQIEFYDIVEDWIFDAGRGVMVVHIWAMAPMAYVDGQPKPLFWLRYADNRGYFDQQDVYNGGKKMELSWDEYFESRQFSSRITSVEKPLETSVETKEKRKRKSKKHKGNDDTTEVSHDVWVY